MHDAGELVERDRDDEPSARTAYAFVMSLGGSRGPPAMKRKRGVQGAVPAEGPQEMIAIAAADARRFLAEEIRVCANIRSAALVDALASIPRERFLARGPWQIRGSGDMSSQPRRTDDADPRHVYHDVAIAIDPDRNLYNGQPSLIARWLDELAIAPVNHVLHVSAAEADTSRR